MENLLIYILQVNVLLSIVYLGYILLLKGLTFYNLNRGYFLVGMLFSFIYPFLDVKSWFTRHVEPIGELVDFMPNFVSTPAPDNLYSINNVLLVAVAAGATFFFLRLLIQSASVLRVHWNSSSALWHTFSYRNVRFPVAPFSFLRQIYLYRKQHDEQELTHIFKHELVHTNGLHSLDVLLTELVYTCCWYNPLVFIMRKAIHQNLEFLTDQQVLDLGIDRQTYQYNLLHVNRTGLATPITNKFNFKMLKQRIMMMNKKRSSKLELSKYAMLIPVLVLASAAFTVNKVEANIHDAVEKGKISVLSNDFLMHDAPITDTGALCLDDIFAGEKFAMVDTNDPRAKGLKKIEAQNDDTTLVIVKKDRSNTPEGANSGITIRKQSGDPLYVVDGTVMLPKDFKNVNPNDIERIEVLKDGSATAAYGEKGKNGVLLVTTKDSPSTTKKVTGSGTFQRDSTITKIKASSGNEPKPLYVLDGIIIKESDMDGVDPKSIESVSVLKDNSATAIYGEQAKNGAVLIVTKQFNHGVKGDEKTAKEPSRDQGKQPGTPTGLFGSPESWSKKDSPIVVVDDEIQKNVDVKKINTKGIVNIRKLTGKDATDKYGQVAKNGAVEVTTKAAAKKADTKK